MNLVLLLITDLGTFYFFDFLSIRNTRTGQVLHQLQLHSAPAFHVTWCASDPDLLASASSDHNVVVFRPDGQLLHVLQHPGPTFGCDFCPSNKHLLATGCQDGTVRLWDLDANPRAPRAELRGHSARVFHVLWSPLLPDYLCSGSDDRTIGVWNIASQQGWSLRGHTSNVRALVWHTEIPYLLLSGSWDGSIRVWDIRSQTCLSVLSDHHADVYGLAAHPLRPFTFVSSSRDTTVRLWQLDLPEVSQLRLRALLAGAQLPAAVLAEPSAASLKSDAPFALSGPGSRTLDRQLRAQAGSGAALLERMRLLFEFFGFWADLGALFGVAATHLHGTPAAAGPNPAVHLADLRRHARAEARALERAPGLGAGAGRAAERLAAAAEVALQSGNLREHCELLVRQELWERALALAPGVSMAFWADLSRRYAQHLTQRADEAAVAHHLAVGDVDRAVNFYLAQGDLESAFKVAASHALNEQTPAGGALSEAKEATPSATVASLSTSSSATAATSTTTSDAACEDDEKGALAGAAVLVAGAVSRNETLSLLAQQLAQRYSNRGRPLLAAALHLACADGARALQKLLRGAEVELAYAFMQLLRMRRGGLVDSVLQQLARKCERFSMWYVLCLQVLVTFES